jgi:hypothetical protein
MNLLTTSAIIFSLVWTSLSNGPTQNYSMLLHILEHHSVYEPHSHHDNLDGEDGHEHQTESQSESLQTAKEAKEEGKPVSPHRHNIQNQIELKWYSRIELVKEIILISHTAKSYFKSPIYHLSLTDMLFRPPRNV